MENTTVMPNRDGVLREILRTPFVKDIIRSGLKNKTHEKNPSVVMTLIWEDPEIILSILGTLPVLINSCAMTANEVGKQVNEKFSPQLLSDYLGSILGDVNKDHFKACADTYATLIRNLWEASPELRSTVTDILTDVAPKVLGQGINAAARFVNTAQKEDPRAVRQFVSKVVENIDGKEFKAATHTITGALLDQKLPMVSWSWQFMKKRFRK
jgi:hypothetical protein